jgi:hypothetical protein
MENENQETIIDSTQNNEEVVETTKEEVVEPAKTRETPEAKKARLTRQLKQVNKELGVEEVQSEKETKTTKENEFGLVEKGYLRSADIVEADEIELAQTLQKETGKDLDILIESKYFKSELKELRDSKAISKATSGVEGGGGDNKASNTPEHWIAKGVPPTKEQVPDRKTRVKIARAMMKDASTSGKRFYND